MATKATTNEARVATPLGEIARGVAWLVGTAIAVRLVETLIGRSPLGAALAGAVVVDLAMTRAGVRWDDDESRAKSSKSNVWRNIGIGVGSGGGQTTGDNNINGDAPVVVMTTEVLRNMLYAMSDALQGLSYVVMDEVHFLADRMRGAVWEEVILHLPDDVRLVSLSATVSNAEEFGGWIQTVRGDTTVIVDEHRPVPLWQHMLVGKRLFDLFDYQANKGAAQKLVVDPNLVRHIAHRREADRMADWAPRDRGRGRGDRSHRPTMFRPPARPDVIATLEREGLLPAITFIFSRAGCDAAVKQCLRSAVRLTNKAERDRIAEVIDRRETILLVDDDPVALDNFWLKRRDQAVLDLREAKNPQVGMPEGMADVEWAVDIYFPAAAPGVEEPLKGLAAHSKGRNRLWLDGHVAWSRDPRLR